ncbi:hypothetical protein TIFTF001_004734 [Ficus carica]|uniref:Secreted protein n=1 Tax=Ficus carica TaxID=3494 RepID=A0AA87ZH74_FICCA|nr:hypothetical protein TIFTF001_004734 [Ficus carica]
MASSLLPFLLMQLVRPASSRFGGEWGNRKLVTGLVGGHGGWTHRRGWLPRGWEPLQHKWGERNSCVACCLKMGRAEEETGVCRGGRGGASEVGESIHVGGQATVNPTQYTV